MDPARRDLYPSTRAGRPYWSGARGGGGQGSQGGGCRCTPPCSAPDTLLRKIQIACKARTPHTHCSRMPGRHTHTHPQPHPSHSRCWGRPPAGSLPAGDLLAALLLAWMHHHPGDLAAAVELAVAGLQAVLTDTAQRCGPAALAAVRTAEVCARACGCVRGWRKRLSTRNDQV